MDKISSLLGIGIFVFTVPSFRRRYLPPIKGREYSIIYEGPKFREPVIPLRREDREYIIPIFEEQVRQGILGEVTEDTDKLDYVSNMFLKTESDKKRPCINYRRLNDGTVKTNMPIPNKEEILSKLAGKDFYISMDAKAAYNQLPVAKESQMLIVFVVPGIDGSPRYFYPKYKSTHEFVWEANRAD